MQVLGKFIVLAGITSILLDLASLPPAEGSTCPCTSNSPIINPFPYRSLRWGTSIVRQGTKECPIETMKKPRIAIARIVEGSQEGPIRGYQLVVVDGDNRQMCAGTQLAGIVFNYLYKEHDEPVVIRQVARAKVTPDSLQKEACLLDEYRLVYMLASVHRPDDSLCTHRLKNSRVRRAYRTLFGFGIPSLPPPEISPSVTALSEIYPNHLADYVVVIPNADYDSNGMPQTPNSQGLSPVPDKGLEWYELACAGGALAHTDLTGLVEPGESQEVRTAAMRMLRANYRGNNTKTVDGVPISFRRDKPHTPEYKQLCENAQQDHDSHATDLALETGNADARATGGEDLAGRFGTDCHSTNRAQDNHKLRDIEDEDVEARWTSRGAACVSHSRLWMRDGVVHAAQRYPGRLQDSEPKFLNDLKKLPPVNGGPDLVVPCDPSFKHSPTVWFTSGVFHHIKHSIAAHKQAAPGRPAQ
jgi:hypothetical protein